MVGNHHFLFYYLYMKKRRVYRSILLVLALIAVVLGGVLAYVLLHNEKTSVMYLASTTNLCQVVDEDGNQFYFPRGKEITLSNKTKAINDDELSKIYVDEDTYYVSLDSLVSEREASVLTSSLYVYRTCTVYEDKTGSKIAGIAYKGDSIQITDHSPVNDDGGVDRYGYSGGYIRSKYLTDDESLLSQTSSFSNDTDNPYGAGSASQLDYSNDEVVSFGDNLMPDVCKTLYINREAMIDIEDYIELAKKTSVNTFVIDIRDAHVVSYKSDVMKQNSPTSYDAAYFTKEEFKAQLDKVKEAGIYMVGRITVFKDKNYMIDHPEYAILDLNDDNKPFEYGGSYWPSAYVRDVWEYNVEIAKEAVSDLGFNEIEFDYVRFPEQIDYYADTLNALDLQNTYNETRSQAIQRFLMYACDELHDLHAYVSADVFGETSNNYVTAYGQYWPAISNIVDVISPMPYPDHFGSHAYDIEEVVWTVPYKLMYAWGSQALGMQNITPNRARVRTFIQGYNSINEPYVVYDNEKLLDQINGLIDSGIYDNGYIVWNSGSYIDNYYLYEDALSR